MMYTDDIGDVRTASNELYFTMSNVSRPRTGTDDNGNFWIFYCNF